MKSFIILLFIIIISILILYIINNNNFESFTNINGAKPSSSGNQWGNNTENNTETEESSNDCQVGNTCSTENGYGTLNKNCVCVINSTYEEEEQQEEEEYQYTKRSHRNSNQNSGTGSNEDLTNCYPNNTNFDAVCKNINSEYGIKEIIKCDSNNSKVDCKKNYINGEFLGPMSTLTPCLDKTDDFNTWCRYYNSNPVPPGYNVNSIGAKKLLVGKKGNCFFEDGSSNNHKARAVCDYNHTDEVHKLERANDKINYNIFTGCHPLKPTNFVSKCSPLLHVPYEHSFATQIMGYDCNPGFGRAKCIKSKDIDNYNKSQYDEVIFGNVVSQIQDNNNCCNKNNMNF